MDRLDYEDTRGAGGYELYIENSSAPLTGFLFALPLFVVYHAGLWWLSTFAGMKWANAIDIAIADFLGRLGMAGPLLSFILVVIVFLAMHALTGKPWRRPPVLTWFFMVAESLVMALPVFLLSQIVVKILDYLPLSLEDGLSGPVSWQANLILSCGAGVYEEFFFRILVMGALAFVFMRVLGLGRGWSFVLAAVGQALLFSLSHHLPGGPERIADLAQARAALPAFSFRTVAGLYFAGLYLERGFGIAAGAHAGYDLMIVTLEMLTPMEYGS